MNYFKIILSFIIFSSFCLADTRPAVTTTIAPTVTTIPNNCDLGGTNCGILPQATGVLTEQKKVASKLQGLVAGGCAAIVVTTVTWCMAPPWHMGVCVAACIGVASMLKENVEVAAGQTQAAINATTSNTTYPTGYNNGPTPTPVPLGDGGGGISVKPPPTLGAKKPAVVTLPDGRKFNPSDINNPSALSSAGFSGAEIQGMQSASKAIAAKISDEIGKGHDKGESMFGDELSAGGRKNIDANSDAQAMAIPKMPGDPTAADAKVDATGLVKACGDSMCGTANDGLFIMINRQVVKQCGLNTVSCK